MPTHEYRQDHLEQCHAYDIKYRETHHLQELKRGKRNREKNPNYLKEYCRKNSAKIHAIRKKWYDKHPHYIAVHFRIYRLIYNHPELYPLSKECVFCGTTENLEHGHLDYEDEGYNYVTTCHTCNNWMKMPLDYEVAI